MSPAAGKPAAQTQPKVGALIRARRQQLRMTLQALGDAAGVSVGYLSQVERDHATPSLGTLAQIARSLDLGVDYFIATPSAEDGLTRSTERNRFSVDGSSIIYERIAADFTGNVLSSFILNVPPGYRSETVSHEGEEILFVLSGSISLRLDEEDVTLSDGDSMHFRGNRPHSWTNDSDEIARLLWTGTLPMFRSRAERPALRSSRATGKTKKTSHQKENTE
ncbi:helix-turn-helix domain-containing protein [Paradevosia shaoguanensis]|uniref:XRE family transcriptional regulator n=1 Tax=Paradevosia shaoguanensis TaxID=1335043 RepID=A0AA41QI64_9HYPH|nr:XRE family transcriptional regulator [Paradevosia shaoguanensis]MCF1740863.1 XRE family transcriptional regulator [Paradevosia shaoguanensis]MCI0125347.1 XRE family transcriptional regulator [Paradevosia shaoguanensis]